MSFPHMRLQVQRFKVQELDMLYAFDFHQAEESVRFDHENENQDNIGDDFPERGGDVPAGECLQQADNDAPQNGPPDTVQSP